jgi:ABC-type nitrate/sulfonate/bicarbonate transport system substrate-binding protein
VVAATREWAKNNADTVIGVIRAYREGLEWLRNSANKQAALDILRAELPETSAAVAEETYGFLVAAPKGFDAGGKLDLAGAKHVLELRRKYGPEGKTGTDIAQFIDESYFAQAAK